MCTFAATITLFNLLNYIALLNSVHFTGKLIHLFSSLSQGIHSPLLHIGPPCNNLRDTANWPVRESMLVKHRTESPKVLPRLLLSAAQS